MNSRFLSGLSVLTVLIVHCVVGCGNDDAATEDTDTETFTGFEQSDDTSNSKYGFFTTRVSDGLDPEDMLLMQEALLALGYTELGESVNVTSGALRMLLEDENITTLYHTGHGYVGTIATSDGSLSVTTLKGGVSVRNLILATCLTVSTVEWMDRMNDSSFNILGYTDNSYDIIDNYVAQVMGLELGGGRSYIEAWYMANTAGINDEYLGDRWLGYVREEDGPVEYSARSGIAPRSGLAGDTVDLHPKVRVRKGVLDTSVARSGWGAIGLAPAEAQTAFYSESESFLPLDGGLSETNARAVAETWLAGQLPMDATFGGAHPVFARPRGGQKRVVAYRIVYKRVRDGVAVESNIRPHHIGVLVNRIGVVASSRFWPPVLSGEVRTNRWRSPKEAIYAALPELVRIAKKQVTYVTLEPVYGATEGALVPAYTLRDQDGVEVVIDAVQGGLLK